MSYTKKTWVDEVTPLSAANMNNLEKQYEEVKTELAKSSDGDISVDAANVTAASTSSVGVVQLSTSTASTSSVLAATPSAVKAAYDLAAIADAKIIPLYQAAIYTYTTSTTAGDALVTDRADTTFNFNLEQVKIHWESELATGRSVYFEAVLGSPSAGTTAYCALRNSAGDRFGEVSTAASGFNIIRSAAINLTNDGFYYPSFWSSAAVEVRLYAARLIII